MSNPLTPNPRDGFMLVISLIVLVITLMIVFATGARAAWPL